MSSYIYFELICVNIISQNNLYAATVGTTKVARKCGARESPLVKHRLPLFS